MNTIDVLKISANGQMWDFMDGSVRVQRSFTDTNEELFTATELTDSVYYSNNQRMKAKQWNFVVRLEDSNDYAFKRFINLKDETGKKQATFRFDISVNGVAYVVYGTLASQESVVDFGVIKQYSFTMNLTTRALTFTRIEQNAGTTTGDVYNTATYNVGKYSSIVEFGTFSFNFDNNADTDSYFQIKGKGVGTGVYFIINGTRIDFNILSLPINDVFEYSNIPTQLKININGTKRLDVINLGQNTFIIPTKNGINNIYISGLQGLEIDVVKGYKIL